MKKTHRLKKNDTVKITSETDLRRIIDIALSNNIKVYGSTIERLACGRWNDYGYISFNGSCLSGINKVQYKNVHTIEKFIDRMSSNCFVDEEFIDFTN